MGPAVGLGVPEGAVEAWGRLEGAVGATAAVVSREEGGEGVPRRATRTTTRETAA